MARILLLDAQNQNALAIVRHLGQAGHYIETAGSYNMSLAKLSRYSKRFHLINKPTAFEGFKNDLLKIISTTQFDVVMPCGYNSFEACARMEGEIKTHSHIVLTTLDNMRLGGSKSMTYNLAEQLGIPYPKTYRVNSLEELAKTEIMFPAVVKAPFEVGKNIVEYVHSKDELLQVFKAMCAKNNFAAPNLPLIQEYVVGDGYGFFAYYEQGVLKRYFMHHRLREYPVTGGASVCAESFRDDALKEYGKRMLDHLQWNGVAMVEFKKDNKSNTYKLMEINPKFWGSLELAIRAGVNFPQYYVDQATGNEVSYDNEYKDVKFQWVLNGELFHAIERPRDIPAILGTFGKAFTDFSITDIMPNLYQLIFIPIHYYKKLRG